jgi:hypothetical protein
LSPIRQRRDEPYSPSIPAISVRDRIASFGIFMPERRQRRREPRSLEKAEEAILSGVLPPPQISRAVCRTVDHSPSRGK